MPLAGDIGARGVPVTVVASSRTTGPDQPKGVSMSVTFQPDIRPRWRVGCAFATDVFEDYAAAEAAAAAHGPDCAARDAWLAAHDSADHDTWVAALDTFEAAHPERWSPWWCEGSWGPTPVYPDGFPTVNLANDNATLILELLGLAADDRCGSLPADDFAGRVLVARGLNPTDPGRPPVEHTGAAGAVVVDCGRRVGYVDEVLDRLRTVADHASRHGVAVRLC
jgi:hypothetical protein